LKVCLSALVNWLGVGIARVWQFNISHAYLTSFCGASTDFLNSLCYLNRHVLHANSITDQELLLPPPQNLARSSLTPTSGSKNFNCSVNRGHTEEVGQGHVHKASTCRVGQKKLTDQ